MYDYTPSAVPTVLAALRDGNLATVLDTLDLDEREEFVIALPAGHPSRPTTHTLIRFGNTQGILTLGGDDADVSLTLHAHDNEADAVQCHEWKADKMRALAAEAYAMATGPAGQAFSRLMESGAIDQFNNVIGDMLKHLGGRD